MNRPARRAYPTEGGGRESVSDDWEQEAEPLRWELAGLLERERHLHAMARTVETRLIGEFGQLLCDARVARCRLEFTREERVAVEAALRRCAEEGTELDYPSLEEALGAQRRRRILDGHSALCRTQRELEGYPDYFEYAVVAPSSERLREGTRRFIYLLHPGPNPERLYNEAARTAYRFGTMELSGYEYPGRVPAEAKILALVAETETSPEWSLPEDLPYLLDVLRRRIRNVRRRIAECLETPPGCQLHLLEDPAVVERHRDHLRAAIRRYLEEYEEEKAQLSALLGR